ncbi:sulfate permease [Emericellopsis atlantica]|uniref:Sulfate permease n=1 Tax=Emericellopsis atlantica TaxID=2614577 RepID=A0A9P7ZTV5_9HYPO|nr:sulfate permease [Emericellopsis atlantica]KAG9258204.1 sulfate permease [Emericellopsis atlantica]
MNWFTKTKGRMAQSYRTDPNLNKWKSWVGPVTHRLPTATVDYLVEKLPVVQWLPHYHPKWLLQDIIAGITIGVMFIPQGLAYAQIATIPTVHGLYSCWIPSALYFFLGTSKELSTGPTSILGLLTADVVADLSKEGYGAAAISSAIAFMVGVYTIAIGLLKLGFLLDFVSAPVLSGWISAVALVILLGQVDSLVGLDVGSGTATIIREILSNLDKIKPLTLAIGFTCIFILVALEHVGKRWGKKNKYLKLFCTSRAVVVLIIYTLISYLVNRGLGEDNYKWKVTKVQTEGLWRPRMHDTKLLSKVVGRAFAPLIAMAVEHLGVGKAFGLRNGYTIDKSQELVFLGIENFVNSFFGAMTTGAAMSRTAVNSECGVKSPVNFLFTSGFVILTIYELAPALYWIPKATLSAIIIMAVVHLVSPPRLFYRYYRMSFVDFVASMLGFWVTLFTTTEIGLGTAVGFNIVVTLLRLAFPGLKSLSNIEVQSGDVFSVPRQSPGLDALDVPPEAFYVRYTDDLLFPNAERLKAAIVEKVKVHYEPSVTAIDMKSADRSWNVSDMKRIPRIRQRKGIQPIRGEVAALQHVVLDMSMVSFMDITGCLSIIELKMELRRYIGQGLQFRFLNMSDQVMERFRRSEWEFARDGEERSEKADVIYTSLESALHHREGSDREDVVNEKALEV